MKQEKGITITSLIVYIIAMTMVIGIVASISKNFYNNTDDISKKAKSIEIYTKFNRFITAEINTKNNEPIYPLQANGETDYIIFSKSNNQYAFKDNSIYLNKTKICSNIKSCLFSFENNNLRVKIETEYGDNYDNTYKIVNY